MTNTNIDLPRSLFAVAALCACAEDLRTRNDGEQGQSFGVRSRSLGAEVQHTTVDASDEEAYIYFDIDADEQSSADEPQWDLAFCRFKIKTNGGDSGDGEVLVARLADTDFESVELAPERGYVEDSDEIAQDSEGGDPQFAFLGSQPWYEYDGETHELSPAKAVYVVRSTLGAFYKVELLDYYDDAGTAGHPQFRWAPVQAPEDLSTPSKGAQQETGESEAAEPPGSPAAGCYDPSDHTCTCERDEESCLVDGGIWTDRCACDAA